jgi:hypothetical protein
VLGEWQVGAEPVWKRACGAMSEKGDAVSAALWRMRFDVLAVDQLGIAVNKRRMPTREIIRLML